MYIHHSEPRYRAPLRTAAPAADRNRCPVCNAEGFRAPGPCESCKVYGYHGGEPANFRRRVWRLHGRDYLPDTEVKEIDTDDQDESEEIQDEEIQDEEILDAA